MASQIPELAAILRLLISQVPREQIQKNLLPKDKINNSKDNRSEITFYKLEGTCKRLSQMRATRIIHKD